MKEETEPMPRFWWLTPWTFSIQQWRARERHFENYMRLSRLLGQEKLKTLPDHLRWMPIATAPKDGTQLLLYCGDWNGIIVGHYGELITWDDETGDEEVEVCWQSNLESYNPTHWQSLPKPPNKK
jgi:hypothetical protein